MPTGSQRYACGAGRNLSRQSREGGTYRAKSRRYDRPFAHDFRRTAPLSATLFGSRCLGLRMWSDLIKMGPSKFRGSTRLSIWEEK